MENDLVEWQFKLNLDLTDDKEETWSPYNHKISQNIESNHQMKMESVEFDIANITFLIIFAFLIQYLKQDANKQTKVRRVVKNQLSSQSDEYHWYW